MGMRPITGWAYEPGATNPWATALHPTFGVAATSEPPLDEALREAGSRWGASRVATVVARTTWGWPKNAGLGYVSLGPSAREDVVHSAWSLIELDAADAVVCTVDADSWSCSVLLERTGDSQLQLRSVSDDPDDVLLLEHPDEGLRALVVAAIAIERGIPCAGGVEPDRIGVVLSGARWLVETRA